GRTRQAGARGREPESEPTPERLRAPGHTPTAGRLCRHHRVAGGPAPPGWGATDCVHLAAAGDVAPAGIDLEPSRPARLRVTSTSLTWFFPTFSSETLLMPRALCLALTLLVLPLGYASADAPPDLGANAALKYWQAFATLPKLTEAEQTKLTAECLTM